MTDIFSAKGIELEKEYEKLTNEVLAKVTRGQMSEREALELMSSRNVPAKKVYDSTKK